MQGDGVISEVEIMLLGLVGWMETKFCACACASCTCMGRRPTQLESYRITFTG